MFRQRSKVPKISIIIPVYNVEKYLSHCLDSILAQTYSDFEAICINDGSTDNSLKILHQYLKKDTRFNVINQENMGLSCARNAGLSIAQGEFIAFIDSDDFVDPEFLEILYNTQQQNGSDIVGCDFFEVKDNQNHFHRCKKHITSKTFKHALDILLNKKNFIHFNVWNKLYKKEAIGDIRFLPGLFYEDWVFNCCVFAQINTFTWIAEKLYGYRLSNVSIMRSKFTKEKLESYVKGIDWVSNFYKQNFSSKWEKLKKTRVSRTVKTMINSTLRANNNDLCKLAQLHLQNLYNQKLIGYRGLSFRNKLKLFKFLNMRL